MKQIIFVILLLPLFALSQPIPKKATSITITIAGTDPELVYKGLADLLMDQGYTIERSDRDLGIIHTERKKVKYAWEVRISAAIRGNQIKFTGKQFLPDFDSSEHSIEYIGAKGAMYKTCFEEVTRVAKLYPHTLVEYR